jgi:hypothetical protein
VSGNVADAVNLNQLQRHAQQTIVDSTEIEKKNK